MGTSCTNKVSRSLRLKNAEKDTKRSRKSYSINLLMSMTIKFALRSKKLLEIIIISPVAKAKYPVQKVLAEKK